MNDIREIIKYLKNLGIPPNSAIKDKKKTLKLKYLNFIDVFGYKNTIDMYRKYRSACRVAFGFDLTKQRPIKKVDNIEIQKELKWKE